MAALHEIVRATVEGYAVEGANFKSFLTLSTDGSMFTVVDIATNDLHQRFTATSLIVRLIGELVVIEYDDNDKPLVDALIQAGIPRSQIVLAYKGEPMPARA
jgi:hypothetical protein